MNKCCKFLHNGFVPPTLTYCKHETLCVKIICCFFKYIMNIKKREKRKIH